LNDTLLNFIYPTTGFVGNPILENFELNNLWKKLDHFIFFGTLEKK
jgi:hypothetical protein